MKNLSPSLAALALAGIAATPSFGASIADDLTLKVKGVIQARATLGADATDNQGNGQDFYGTNGVGANPNPATSTGSESEMVRFGIRRARLSFDAANSTGWFANTTIRAEPIELSGGNANSTGVAIYYAYIGKRFKGETIEHELKLGLDKSWNNEGSISSSNQLFGVSRPLATLIDFQREPGVSYKLSAPFLKAGFDIQNGTNLSRNAGSTPPSPVGPNTNGNSGNYDKKPTPFTSFRIEVSPGAEFMPVKKTESWAGAEGRHALLGFEYQNSGNSYAVINEERKFTEFGPDLMGHWNGLSFLAEYRWTKLSQESTGASSLPSTAPGSIDGQSWGVQGGYAIPLENGLVIEPAIRYSITNLDSDQEENSSWGLNGSRDNNVGNPANYLTQTGLTNAGIAAGSTNFGSGSQFDIGVNLYWNGHANKTQIGYMMWTAESGSAEASAFYVQQQVTF